jgi:hypothetical protein
MNSEKDECGHSCCTVVNRATKKFVGPQGRRKIAPSPPPILQIMIPTAVSTLVFLAVHVALSVVLCGVFVNN